MGIGSGVFLSVLSSRDRLLHWDALQAFAGAPDGFDLQVVSPDDFHDLSGTLPGVGVLLLLDEPMACGCSIATHSDFSICLCRQDEQAQTADVREGRRNSDHDGTGGPTSE